MTKKIGNTLIIESEEPDKCTNCGKVADLRPYGKNGAKVCFQCAMKDEENMKKQFSKVLNGEGEKKSDLN